MIKIVLSEILLSFFDNSDFINECKMNLRIIMKNHAADPEAGFPTKSILKPYGRATAMPTLWELNLLHHSNDHGFDLFNGAQIKILRRRLFSSD